MSQYDQYKREWANMINISENEFISIHIHDEVTGYSIYCAINKQNNNKLIAF